MPKLDFYKQLLRNASFIHDLMILLKNYEFSIFNVKGKTIYEQPCSVEDNFDFEIAAVFYRLWGEEKARQFQNWIFFFDWIGLWNPKH